MHTHYNRRKLLKTLSAIPVIGSLLATGLISAKGNERSPSNEHQQKPLQRDLFKELGVRTFINAAGTYTSLSACLMPREVIEAIKYSSKEYVDIDELQDKVGKRIASLLECEDATVTSGAFGAISIGIAGAMCGMDLEKVTRLPNTSGMKNEIIVQEAHHIEYCHAIQNTGARLVIVKSANQLEQAINSKTAMLWYLNHATPEGEIKHQQFLELARKYNVPTFIDCAADVPPVENLFKYTKMGFDLVAFSGGKGLTGPQSAGLLIGKKPYIRAAKLHTPPRKSTIGSGLEVNRGEILGMLVALENFLSRDHEKLWKLWEKQIKYISDVLSTITTVETEIYVPPYASRVPTLRFTWNEKLKQLTPDELRKKLRAGHPSIEIGKDERTAGLTTWMMIPGQERIVAERIKQELTNA